jgi:hypothetical protein
MCLPIEFVLPWVDGLSSRRLIKLDLFLYDHIGSRMAETLVTSDHTSVKKRIEHQTRLTMKQYVPNHKSYYHSQATRVTKCQKAYPLAIPMIWN